MLPSRWSSGISLRSKILGLSVTLLLLMLTAGIYSIRSMTLINGELVAIAEEDIPLTKAVTAVTVNQLEQAIWFERAVRFGEQMQDNLQLQNKFHGAKVAFDKYSTRVNNFIDSSVSQAAEAVESTQHEVNQQKFKQLLIELEKIDDAHKSYEAQARQVFDLLSRYQTFKASELANAVEADEDQIDHALETLLHEIEDFTATAARTAEEHEQNAVLLLMVILGFSLSVGLAAAILITRDVVRRVSYAVVVAETIASGDLRVNVTASDTDEIGRLLSAMRTMRENLRNMVMQLSESSGGLSVSSEELSATTTQMSASVENQRENLELVATAFNEMTATAQEVAQNAAITAARTADAATNANEGRSVIGTTVGSIRGLADAVESAASVIGKLGQDSETISSIIDVIKGIAEQTNLLALNAAIEAARAGEQGRGFAVVADEVRTLAQRTQESTSEIESMIDRLQASARSAVKTMENGRSLAQQSVENVSATDCALESIASAVDSINDMNIQVASAAEEQTQVSEEINRNITAINAAAEENAAAMTQTAGASEELAHMASTLQQQIEAFRVS